MHIFRRFWTVTASATNFININSLILNHYRSYKRIVGIYPPINKFYPHIKPLTVNFHTSQTKSAPPPAFWSVLQPVLNFFAIVCGRRIRKWWRTLPNDEKIHFLNTLRRRRYSILRSCTAFSCGISAYYFYHVEEQPITKRKRFNIFTQDQINQLSDLLMMEIEKRVENIVPHSRPTYKRVERVVMQLLHGNQDLLEVREKKWSVTVVNDEMINAFVFMNGHIFVYNGILEKCGNDDQLGIVLGHEMAHAILGHLGENLSNAYFVKMLSIIPLVIIWSVFPDMAAIIFQMITTYFVKLIAELPYSRSIEREADEFGLKLAAKSCFDVRQAIEFWKNMSTEDPLNKKIEFLSSHPSHKRRKEYLERLMPPALKLRRLCKCPDLD